MNPNILKLNTIAQKKERKIIGLMSGTSLDGLDIALCTIRDSGKKTTVVLNHFVTNKYSEQFANELRMISSVEKVNLSEVCYLHTSLAWLHADWILEALSEWSVNPKDVDCIASHGQTIYHYPARDQTGIANPMNSTLQIGDGDHIAAKTQILTISDFRQKHTAHNGEGAPMAGFIDKLLFSDSSESRVLLNIGGIGNYTYLPADGEKELEAFTTDTGPGNTLIDKSTQAFFNRPFDRDSKIAASGSVNQTLLQELLSEPWFFGGGSKTTGPEYFSMEWLNKKIQQAGLNVDEMNPEDLIRTVTELSAVTIADHINSVCKENGDNQVVYVSGGGARNPLLVQRLKSLLPRFEVVNFSKLGIDPDAKESVLFAVLANEMIAGEGFEFQFKESDSKEQGKKMQKLNFGKISFPD